MKKSELEIELRNQYDHESGQLTYHTAKKIDANNNVIRASHEEMIELHQANQKKILLWLNRLTDDNTNEIEKEFRNWKKQREIY